MTSTDQIIKQLSVRLINAEIAARRPKDAKAVIDAISPRIRIDEIGNVFVVHKDGSRDDSKSFEVFLDDVKRDRPDLFEGGSTAPTAKGGNPFLKGPSWSVTRQMTLINTDPDTAEKLSEEAGQAPIWRR